VKRKKDLSQVNQNTNPNATARVFFPADQVKQTATASSEMRSVLQQWNLIFNFLKQ